MDVYLRFKNSSTIKFGAQELTKDSIREQPKQYDYGGRIYKSILSHMRKKVSLYIDE